MFNFSDVWFQHFHVFTYDVFVNEGLCMQKWYSVHIAVFSGEDWSKMQLLSEKLSMNLEERSNLFSAKWQLHR
jgi:hypothetical protein